MADPFQRLIDKARDGVSRPVSMTEREQYAAAIEDLLRQVKTLKRSDGEVRHWKANHQNVVEQLRLFKQRPDLPVDRLPAYRRLVELQEENERLRGILAKDPRVIMIAYENGDHQRLSRALGEMQGRALKWAFAARAAIREKHKIAKAARTGLAALKEFVTESRAYQSPEIDECEIIGPVLRQADAAIVELTEALN